jgi:hypothetical protein
MQTINNRRKYFRHQFGTSLCAEIQIISIGDQIVNSKKTYVCVRDIGAGGVRFESHLIFPTTKEVKLELSTIILEKQIRIQGILKRQADLNNGYFQYGMEFKLDEDLSNLLLRLINELNIKSRRTTLPTGCKMCSSYTKCHKNSIEKSKEDRWNRN